MRISTPTSQTLHSKQNVNSGRFDVVTCLWYMSRSVSDLRFYAGLNQIFKVLSLSWLYENFKQSSDTVPSLMSIARLLISRT